MTDREFGPLRNVLLIAFHFPPFSGSSGLQRTLRFAQHLPKFGWNPVVLTVWPLAYDSRAEAVGNELPASLELHRAFGLDAARHLSLFGRYPGWLGVPDRWATWRFHAVPLALRLIRERAVEAVWSTFPIATAHLIGLEVARRSGLPWIAEFRDPMWQGEYPPQPRMNAAWRILEKEIVRSAQRIVVTTPSEASKYVESYPDESHRKFILIENGYDEETFRRAECSSPKTPEDVHRTDTPLRILHSGIVYPEERDPTQLFKAIASLKRQGQFSARQIQFVLRASGNESSYRNELAALQIDDIVRLEPAIDYASAIREMLDVDGLLILQASNCNSQVPAKLYEYLRAGRPILALTDPRGDTARTLEAMGTGTIAPLDSSTAIEAALMTFIDDIKMGTWRRAPVAAIASYSRESQSGQLARLLDQLRAD